MYKCLCSHLLCINVFAAYDQGITIFAAIDQGLFFDIVFLDNLLFCDFSLQC